MKAPIWKRLRSNLTKYWQDIANAALIMFMLGASHAHAQAIGVQGICKMTSFISETVVFAVAACAAGIYGILYAINAAREQTMETVLRVTMGIGVASSGIALVGFLYGRSVC